MVARLRRFFDIRSGEGLPVLLSFLYIAVVVAAFLLARADPQRPVPRSRTARTRWSTSCRGRPLVLSLFVPVYTALAARIGPRAGDRPGTLIFFSLNVVGCSGTRSASRPSPALPGIFYVWVNCFGVIAPVQAWSFANSLFDTRQAKRLFGLIGSGASLGAIAGGFLARVLVGPVGGSINLMLVLAALIAARPRSWSSAANIADSPARRAPRSDAPATRPL